MVWTRASAAETREESMKPRRRYKARRWPGPRPDRWISFKEIMKAVIEAHWKSLQNMSEIDDLGAKYGIGPKALALWDNPPGGTIDVGSP